MPFCPFLTKSLIEVFLFGIPVDQVSVNSTLNNHLFPSGSPEFTDSTNGIVFICQLINKSIGLLPVCDEISVFIKEKTAILIQFHKVAGNRSIHPHFILSHYIHNAAFLKSTYLFIQCNILLHLLRKGKIFIASCSLQIQFSLKAVKCSCNIFPCLLFI